MTRSGDPGTFQVVVVRDPEDVRFWVADVVDLPGGRAYARTLAALDRRVRESIVFAAGLPEDAAQVLRLCWEYRTGDGAVDTTTAELRRRREQLEADARNLAEQTGEVARSLLACGRFSVRDVAALLAISPSRIGQLAPRARIPGAVRGQSGNALE